MNNKILGISVLLFCFCSCTNNHSSIVELINLEEWENATVDTIIRKTRLDTIVFYREGTPPLPSEYGDSIYTFESLLRNHLSIRGELLKELKKNPLFETADYIYIEENQGYRVSGYERYFVLYQEHGIKYVYRYNKSKNFFNIRKSGDENSRDNHAGDTILHDVQGDIFSGMDIVTHIKKNKSNKLIYTIRYAYFD